MQKRELLSPQDEARLLKGIRGRDEQALSQLMEHVTGYLIVVADSMLRNLPDAEEVVQDVIVDFWSRCNSISLEYGIVPYLARAVRLRAISIIRQRTSVKEQSTVSLDASAWETLPQDAVAGLDERDEIIVTVMQHARELPEKQREAISHRLEGLSNVETARKMGISEKGVEINITRALQSLRRLLGS